MSFILLGHQRSGTSYVLDIFQHHPKVDTINEPFSMHLDYFRADETPWSEQDYNTKYFHKDLQELNETVSYIQDLKEWINDKKIPNIKGIKETGLLEKYFWLQKIFHFDQTIILIRDFRAVINSILKRNMNKGWRNYRQRLISYYGYKDSELMDDLTISILILKHRMVFLNEIIKKQECLVIRLEDLLTSMEITLENLMNYIKLNVHKAQLDFIMETSAVHRNSIYSNYRIKERVINAWKTDLSENAIKIIEDQLADELQEFGYL